MDFVVNDDLSAYSAEEITNLITAGNERLTALFASENPTPAEVDEAEQIVASLARLQAEQSDREGATDRMAALRESFTATPDEPEVPEDPEEEDPEEDPEPEPEPEPEPAKAPAVTASAPKAKTPVRAKAAGVRPPAVEDTKPRVTLTASADVPGFATGQNLVDLNDVAKGVIARAKGFPMKPQGIEGGQMYRYGTALLDRNFPAEVTADGTNDQQVLDFVTKESRLPGGSLVAAGGWCAPSENLYDFCEGETTDGIISLPELNAPRGGVRTTPGPSFATLYSSTGFTQTEAQAIAGTTKPCYEVTCPTFTETRLDVIGLCIKVPILTNAAYPELVRRVISGSLVAHQHRVNADLITRMLAKATAVTTASVGSVTGNLLNGIALTAETLRGEYRLSLNATLEVALPSWVREAIRADMGMRAGADAALVGLADAAIEGFFRARKVNVQWLYDWQMLVDGEEGFPTTFVMMVYPAGTFVKLTQDVISLDTVYDAASLSVNTYTGLFMEEGIGLLQNCWKAKKVTVAVCAGGVTGAANQTACFNLT
jgi:hypothetical protein